jgi:hypothetical protein
LAEARRRYDAECLRVAQAVEDEQLVRYFLHSLQFSVTNVNFSRWRRGRDCSTAATSLKTVSGLSSCKFDSSVLIADTVYLWE